MKTKLKINKKKYTENEVYEILNKFMNLVHDSKRDIGWHVELSSSDKYIYIKFNFKEDYDEYYEHEEE